MSTMPRRRYIFRDRDLEAGWTNKLGTATARVFLAMVEPPPKGTAHVEFMQSLVLLGAAHHQDLMAASGQPQMVTYPEDVADLTGQSQSRVAAMLTQLKAMGYLTGSFQAGYRLAGPLVAPRAFDEDR